MDEIPESTSFLYDSLAPTGRFHEKQHELNPHPGEERRLFMNFLDNILPENPNPSGLIHLFLS